MNNILKNIAIIAALIILSVVALSGNYVKLNHERICNATNTECDLSQENNNPLDQAIMNKLVYKNEAEYKPLTIRSIYNGKL